MRTKKNRKTYTAEFKAGALKNSPNVLAWPKLRGSWSYTKPKFTNGVMHQRKNPLPASVKLNSQPKSLSYVANWLISLRI